jgi:choline dehydrogenase-like flavoprotein
VEVIRRPNTYDVVIIGSGAGGGMAAMVLTQGGLNCALLEAGPSIDPAVDYKEHIWPYESMYRGWGPGYFYRDKPYIDEFSAHLGSWDLKGEPYVVAEGQKFRWFRSRVLGGRTNIWGRVSLRFAPYDFKPHSTDGGGEDWPISYDDIAPYYDRVERLIGVFGNRDGVPTMPDGIYMPPPAPRCYERLVARGCDKLGIPIIAMRNAILTQAHDGRPPCHYCAQCSRGCTTASRFSSLQVLLPKANNTGRLKLITNAMAREILTDSEGRCTAVSYIDRRDRRECQLRARAVVVAGGALESTRLLLNSRSPRFPNGLANSSGAVGRYLSDTVGYLTTAYFPELMSRKIGNEDGISGGHLIIPWWLQGVRGRDFRRGYHIELFGGPEMGAVTGNGRVTAAVYDGYGTEFKKHARAIFGSTFGLSGRGEMIPNDRSWVEIDPQAVDAYGVPVLQFHWGWGEEELAMVRHMQRTFGEIIDAAGGKPIWRPNGISEGGEILHELGTARMGADARTSVLNSYNQAYDSKNLFVVDGAAFTSNPEKNPTLTILALSMRASEYLLNQAKRGDL